jgi:hypothetical protein
LNDARHHFVGVPGVQAAQLQHDQKQEEDDRAARVQQVLPLLSEAHVSQRDEVIAIADRRLRIVDQRIGD